jgi:predicted choloylglycine hydrolase
VPTPPRYGSTALTFYGIREAVPGPRWRALFDATWPGYRAWYLSEGDAARPDLATARRMLGRHMPELVSTWERLVDLVDGDPTAARMLTLYDPPRFLPGCSQAVLGGDDPVLVRNYDYHPDLCERVVYSSALTGRRVLGTGDCLWGLVDGMNDAGLAVSLAFGGCPGARPGFGIPLVLRYLLEVAETIADARAVLARVPVSMAYNLTMLDGRGHVVTVFVAPGAEPEVSELPVATNHRGTVPDWPEHAETFRSVQRQRFLLDLIARGPDVDELVAAFLRPPLHSDRYAEAFGTMYTAVYRPTLGIVDYVWPGSTWRRGFESPDATHSVVLGQHPDPGSLDPLVAIAHPGDVRSRDDLAGATPDELADLAEAAVRALARSGEPHAFAHLLRLSGLVGECLGASARTLAEEGSWSGVGKIAGMTRQGAWERWRER